MNHQKADKEMNKKYQVTVDRVVHDIYIAWPIDDAVPSEKDRKRLDVVMDILRNAHDAEVLMLPVFDEPLTNKYVHDRVHIIREKLMSMGLGANKISITAPTAVPKGKKAGINLVITEFVVHAPKCKDWSYTVGDFNTMKGMPNFGCYQANYMGKMIANPSSMIQHRKLENDTHIALRALSSYSKGNQVGPKGKSPDLDFKSDAVTNELLNDDKDKSSNALGRAGRGAMGVSNMGVGAMMGPAAMTGGAGL